MVPHSGSASGYDLLERGIADTENLVREYREIVGTAAWHLAEAMYVAERNYAEPPWDEIGTLRQVERANTAKRALNRLAALPYRWSEPGDSPSDASGSMLLAFSEAETQA